MNTYDFTETVTLKLGAQSVQLKRLTVAEIREARGKFAAGNVSLDESYDEIIRTHVTTDDGKPLDASLLSMRQIQKLVTELVGLPTEGGVADFIGLLS